MIIMIQTFSGGLLGEYRLLSCKVRIITFDISSATFLKVRTGPQEENSFLSKYFIAGKGDKIFLIRVTSSARVSIPLKGVCLFFYSLGDFIGLVHVVYHLCVVMLSLDIDQTLFPPRLQGLLSNIVMIISAYL